MERTQREYETETTNNKLSEIQKTSTEHDDEYYDTLDTEPQSPLTIGGFNSLPQSPYRANIQVAWNTIKKVKDAIKEVKDDIKENKDDIKKVKDDIKEVKDDIKENKIIIKKAMNIIKKVSIHNDSNQESKKSIPTSTNQQPSKITYSHKISDLDVIPTKDRLANAVRLIISFAICVPLMPLILPIAGFMLLINHQLPRNMLEHVRNTRKVHSHLCEGFETLPVTIKRHIVDENNRITNIYSPSITTQDDQGKLMTLVSPEECLNTGKPMVIMIPDLGCGMFEYQKVMNDAKQGKYNLCFISEGKFAPTINRSIQDIIQVYTEVYFNLVEHCKNKAPTDTIAPPNITLVGHGMSGGLAAKVMLNILKVDKDAKVKLLTYNTPKNLESGLNNYTLFKYPTIQSSVILSALVRIITKISCLISDIRLLDCHKNMQLLKENFSNAKNAAVASFNNPSDTTIGNETLQNKEKDFDYNVVNASNNFRNDFMSASSNQKLADDIKEELKERQNQIDSKIFEKSQKMLQILTKKQKIEESLSKNLDKLQTGCLTRDLQINKNALQNTEEAIEELREKKNKFTIHRKHIIHQYVDLNLQPIRDFIHDRESSPAINQTNADNKQEIVLPQDNIAIQGNSSNQESEAAMPSSPTEILSEVSSRKMLSSASSLCSHSP
ncbi:hypothetical protein GUI12_04050 [Anaplasmataceae bacterium AB001_6]|nr:hypothetical protein GUI12_04050 [Anaplasmataceae bacterium AB001_6]